MAAVPASSEVLDFEALDGWRDDDHLAALDSHIEEQLQLGAEPAPASFANRVLESAENKTAVQSATRALDKNDRAAYEKAIKTIQCPTQK